MPDIVINLAAIQHLLRDPIGPTARELEKVGDLVVVAAREYCASPYAGRRTRNPPPGPPQQRSGDFIAGMRRSEPRLVDGELTVSIESTAIHRGWYYGRILSDRGYDFLPPNWSP